MPQVSDSNGAGSLQGCRRFKDYIFDANNTPGALRFCMLHKRKRIRIYMSNQ